ncbi:SDR family oxidoreductase [Rhodohalobacter halophilus]|uniref:SDR family oxidoreductase n=1 Tax=Rhodohalobacter halophilus TaxID=1812810 RepID=UPI00083F7015|nr:SDR family oxidoreductase [Rhodohalobacter halophilus]
MGLRKKVIWITGASSGIGEALAYEFNKKGAHLILSARRTGELERVKENCSNHEESVKILPLDLAEADQMEAKAVEALAMYGHVDMLINNGGVSQRSYAVDTEMSTVRKVMEVNFFGTVGLTKALLPEMIKQKSGHIVVISSVMGKFGTKFRSTYAASKHALHGYFDSLRQELYEHNVNVSLVCPGYVKTDVTINALTGSGEKFNKMGKGQKNAMPPEEFAKKLIPKLAAGKDEIYLGGAELMGVYLKRFVPGLFSKLLKRVRVT